MAAKTKVKKPIGRRYADEIGSIFAGHETVTPLAAHIYRSVGGTFAMLVYRLLGTEDLSTTYRLSARRDPDTGKWYHHPPQPVEEDLGAWGFDVPGYEPEELAERILGYNFDIERYLSGDELDDMVELRKTSWASIPDWLEDLIRTSRNRLIERSVWLALWRHADRRPHRPKGVPFNACWPKVATLAEEIGCARSSVRLAIEALVSYGAVSVQERRRHDGSQSSNMYILKDQFGGYMTPGETNMYTSIRDDKRKREFMERRSARAYAVDPWPKMADVKF